MGRFEGRGVARGVSLAGLILLALTGPTPLAGQPTEDQVRAALELLPPAARQGAGVRTRTSDGGWVVRRPAANRWTCRVWTVPGRLVANCHHTVLEGMLDRSAALYDEGLRGDAVFERMGEELRSGHLSIPPGSMEISVSGVIPEASEVPPIMEGNHYLYFPFATAADLPVPDTDPGTGDPWLHYAGTAKAHLMWPREHRPVGSSEAGSFR